MRTIQYLLAMLALGHTGISLAEEAAAKGNASDPTASVNFADFRFQSFDLGDFSSAGKDRERYALEGA